MDLARAWSEATWPVPAGVRGGTSLRSGDGLSPPPFDRLNLGLRCGDDPALARANRARLAGWLALPSEPHWLDQVHGTAVARFDAPPTGGPEPVADAAVTATPGVVLAILSADCLPVLLSARDGREIGAVHAGWRGLAAGALEATVAAMATSPADLLAWLGPAAGPRAYEIGPEVRDAFLAHDPAAATAFTATRPGHWRVDLYALARQRLAAVGVQQVSGGGECTISDPSRYFSHRRDGRSGRMATLAWLAGWPAEGPRPLSAL
ncbi:MAG TPA: peptidoglycan editing factor PgeF [Arenimonas sp.]|uniref:peptidoglycan editing factor PgeF n=1 Tax=Arenimonas sp. TaxID=1872635 RepID=UPI002D7E266F|nr:peptidoglycan editing factor PgeF [Arenimonas sp.]HEU0153909.1 peptidoglycan editing factor PgeF [Arenimonas sp.]